MKKFITVTLLILVYHVALGMSSDIICRYQNEEGYPIPLYTVSGHMTPMGQMYPLAVAAHAYNGENYFGPAFCADFDMTAERKAHFAELLHTDITADICTLTIQTAESACYPNEEVALKPQWAFLQNIPLTTSSFDVGSTVECHVVVADDTEIRTLYFPPTYVNIHGDSDPYVYRLSCNTHNLGFNATDGKTRGIFYSVKFSGGKGFAESLNGQSRVGLLILNGQPLVVSNERLNSCLGKPISSLGSAIPPCGCDEALTVLGIR